MTKKIILILIIIFIPLIFAKKVNAYAFNMHVIHGPVDVWVTDGEVDPILNPKGYYDVNCPPAGDCPVAGYNDSWAGVRYTNNIQLTKPTISTSKKVGDPIDISWRLGATGGTAFAAYLGFEVRFMVVNSGGASIVFDCLNPTLTAVATSGGDKYICLDQKKYSKYPIFAGGATPALNGTQYTRPDFTSPRQVEMTIPHEWSGKKVEFQVIEKFCQGVGSTCDQTRMYLTSYSSTIDIAQDSTPAKSTISNVCQYKTGQNILENIELPDATSVGATPMSEVNKTEINTGQYDGYLPFGVTHDSFSIYNDSYNHTRYYKYSGLNDGLTYLSGFEYFVGKKLITQYETKVSINNGLYTKLDDLISEQNVQYDSANPTKAYNPLGSIKDIRSYIYNDLRSGYFGNGYIYGKAIPTMFFQKNGSYLIHPNDTVQFEITRKLRYVKYLALSNFGYWSSNIPGVGVGDYYPNSWDRFYGPNGITLGNSKITDVSSEEKFYTNKLTMQALPCFIKQIDISSNATRPVINDNITKADYKATVNFAPTFSYPAIVGGSTTFNKAQNFITSPIKIDYTDNYTKYDSGWGLSSNLNDYLKLTGANVKLQKTPTADVSGKIFFDFKYLPDNFIDRNIDEGITQTFLSNVFNKSYVYKYLSTTHNYSWVWDALNNDYTTDPVKHIYPDPGAYHEKVGANLVVEAKQTFPSVSLTSNLQEVCKSSTTGVKLTWASSNATKILSNNFGVNSLSGEATVFPTTDTNYSINVGDNRGNSASSSVYVFVKDCTTQNQTQANNSVFKGVFIGNEISLPNPNGRSMTIEYDSNIVNNPPPGFGDLIAPNWGERVP